MQPPTSKRAYWDTTVKRMKKPFGAQFPDDDIAAMVDYLVKTYGDERPIESSDFAGFDPVRRFAGLPGFPFSLAPSSRRPPESPRR